MKILIIVFLTLLPIFINAQTFWSVVNDDNSHNISHITDKGLFQDSIILLSGFVSDASCPYHNLFAYNQQGHKLWNIHSVCDLITTDKNYIYTFGYDIGTDDVGGDEQFVLSKYSNSGTEITSLRFPTLDTYNDYFDFYPTDIEITEDGKIMISSKTSIIKSNIQCSSIHEYNISSVSNIKGINSINSSLYLINSQNLIYKSDSSFNLLDSIQFENSINKLLIKNDTIYTLVGSRLVRFDTSLNVIDTIFSSNIFIQNIEIYDNQIWIQITQADSIKLINIQAHNSCDTITFPLFLDGVRFIVSENNYTFIGSSFSNQIGLYNFKTNNQIIENISLPDIELIDFDIHNLKIDYFKFQGDSIPIGYSFNPELTIKNNGKETINTFSIFSNLHGGMNCVQNYFYQKLTSDEILPGQTQTVYLNRSYEDGIYNNQLCFRIMAPNSELERKTDNNSLCKTFTITGILENEHTNIKIYPNPFYNFVIIENSELNLKNVEIIDINGRTLIQRIASGQKILIETNNLKAGMYVMKINSRDIISTKLIIKK